MWGITFGNFLEHKSRLLAHRNKCLHFQNTHSCKRSDRSLYGVQSSKADQQGELVLVRKFWTLTLNLNSLYKVVSLSLKCFLDQTYYSNKHSEDMALIGLPSVFVHEALGWQRCEPVLHSLMSEVWKEKKLHRHQQRQKRECLTRIGEETHLFRARSMPLTTQKYSPCVIQKLYHSPISIFTINIMYGTMYTFCPTWQRQKWKRKKKQIS